MGGRGYNAAQAEEIVVTMEKPPGNSDEPPDFSVLRLPVFLAPLQRRAQAGDSKALKGLGSVESKEATEVLIQLANGRKKQYALQAALSLDARLPDPEFDKKLPARGMFIDPGMESRHRLSAAAWDERFSPGVRALAVKFLADKDNRSVECGAFMIEAIGTPKEAAVVEAAIARALGATRIVRDRPENEPGALPELFRAMQMLHQRGYDIGPDLKGEAQACIYFRWLADQPGPRTAEWDKAFETFRGDDSCVVREAAVRSIPQPVPEKYIPRDRGFMPPDGHFRPCSHRGGSGLTIASTSLASRPALHRLRYFLLYSVDTFSLNAHFQKNTTRSGRLTHRPTRCG